MDDRERLRARIGALSREVDEAQGRVEQLESIDAEGLMERVGEVCREALDVSASDSRDVRDDLHQLMERMEALSALLSAQHARLERSKSD